MHISLRDDSKVLFSKASKNAAQQPHKGNESSR
jgi:hypothetical protein